MAPKNFGTAVHKTGSQAGGMMSNLEKALQELEREISADNGGLIEMKTHLEHLRKERGDMQRKVAEMQDFCDNMVSEKSIGGVLKQFDGMEAFLQQSYAKVLEGHHKGIDTLKTEFGYHPAYKKGFEGEFTASYFTPCRNPNNPNRK